MKPGVLFVMHLIAEPWKLITPTKINNCFVKCCFLIDHVSSNDGSAVKLTEEEEDDWHSSQPLGVQSEDYATCDSALKVSGAQSVDQVLDQHLARLEVEPEEEVAEHKGSFVDALEAARKCQ
jgi:23S rRNA U2552 (ribose-2'-O)-methylase RlmE/FtsJ